MEEDVIRTAVQDHETSKRCDYQHCLPRLQMTPLDLERDREIRREGGRERERERALCTASLQNKDTTNLSYEGSAV